jgi:uncharacterized protein YecA (UPF0149 family)
MSKPVKNEIRIRNKNGNPIVMPKFQQRNEKCACGSGYKYKNCCKDKKEKRFNPKVSGDQV